MTYADFFAEIKGRFMAADVSDIHEHLAYQFNITGEAEGIFYVEVKDGKLYIETDSKKKRNQKGTKIYLTAPDLDELSFDGVGSFRCEKTLKVDDIRIDVDGVGSVEMEDLKCETLRLSVDGVGKTDVHVTCRDLRADLDGVGKVVLSGSADHARISKDGVGVCNTNNLKIGK